MFGKFLCLSVITVVICEYGLCSVIKNTAKSDPRVTVEQGELEGRIALDKNGRVYYSFQGIPYAKTPILENRFKAPVKPDSWDGVRSAKKEGNRCPQYMFNMYLGNEDCLFINVYTPNLPQELNRASNNDQLLPVMVWFHGGSFVENSGDEERLGPQYLVAKDVIVVTMNYRLGILGFLSLEDSSLKIPGNSGLKDQVAALKWIKRNIKAFSGDPDNVTIFGNSAGGSSAHLHLVSPMSRGLFKRVSAHSGVAVAHWTIIDSKKFAYRVARVLGHSVTTDKELLMILMNTTDEMLLKATEYSRRNIIIEDVGPTIEIEDINNPDENFLTKRPEDIIRENSYIHVPFITGYTSFEMLYMQKTYEQFPRAIPKTIPMLELYLPQDMNLRKGSKKSRKVAERLIDYYYGDEGASTEKWLQLLSDMNFVYPAQRGIKLMSANSSKPIYMYKFTLDAELNFGKWLYNATLPGASHMDDNGYLFCYKGSSELTPGGRAALGVERMTQLWTNFAKTGNPQVNPKITKWPPVQHNSINLDYLEIGDELVAKQNPDAKNVKFWEDLYEYAQTSE